MPVLTISRMYGSGGSEVAARVAEALGWRLLDNAVVDAVAERSGLSRAEVSEREERLPPMVERIAAAFALSATEMMPPVAQDPVPTTDERIVEITGRVIEEAVRHGPAVLVGRGAQCLLAERKDAVHVFCYAPKASLVAHAIKYLGIRPDEAEKKVADVNREREQYVKRHWNRSWRSPENYHLCVNTGWLGVEGAAEIIVALTRHLTADG